jgi:molybdenum cofactor synthesis domain-containing protein
VIALGDVQAEILAAVPTLDAATVALRDALGCVTACEVIAREAVPPFANTAMDGYAVRAGDTAGASPETPVRLHVIDELPAGRSPEGLHVGEGEAIRIMTGAPMPDGADAVVMVERTAPVDDGVLVHQAARPGDHVRAAAGDLAPGDRVFEPGTLLGPAHLGVLASLGYDAIDVVPRAKVGVLSTGDELVERGPLRPGQIRDSNRPMLLALASEAGTEAVDLGVAPDDENIITRTLEDALACDAVLTSGGVSVGDYDYVKAALDRLGELRWHQVAIKPAKPLAFGVVQSTPVFGLPGNPVSSHVSFELFARPALLQMMGHACRFRPEVTAVAEQPMPRKPDGKLHLDRVRVRAESGRLVAARTGDQASNVLSAMAAANGLALLPDGDGAAEGDDVRVMRLDWPADH